MTVDDIIERWEEKQIEASWQTHECIPPTMEKREANILIGEVKSLRKELEEFRRFKEFVKQNTSNQPSTI